MAARKSGDAPDRATQAAGRLATEVGTEIHDERKRRRWSLRELGRRCGLSATAIQHLEVGRPGSLASYARLGVALGLRPELHLVDERRTSAVRAEDPVHAWMGDVEATQ